MLTSGGSLLLPSTFELVSPVGLGPPQECSGLEDLRDLTPRRVLSTQGAEMEDPFNE